MSKKHIALQIFIINCLLGFITNINAQTYTCKTPYFEGYLIDGQSYTLETEENESAIIHIVFFRGFDYRLYFCSTTTNNYSITLLDIEKNKIITELCSENKKYIDISFNENVATIIYINANNKINNKNTYRFTLYFKENY